MSHTRLGFCFHSLDYLAKRIYGLMIDYYTNLGPASMRYDQRIRASGRECASLQSAIHLWTSNAASLLLWQGRPLLIPSHRCYLSWEMVHPHLPPDDSVQPRVPEGPILGNLSIRLSTFSTPAGPIEVLIRGVIGISFHHMLD